MPTCITFHGHVSSWHTCKQLFGASERPVAPNMLLSLLTPHIQISPWVTVIADNIGSLVHRQNNQALTPHFIQIRVPACALVLSLSFSLT